MSYGKHQLFTTPKAGRAFAALRPPEGKEVLEWVLYKHTDRDDIERINMGRGFIKWMRVAGLHAGALIEPDPDSITLIHLGAEEERESASELARLIVSGHGHNIRIGGLRIDTDLDRVYREFLVIQDALRTRVHRFGRYTKTFAPKEPRASTVISRVCDLATRLSPTHVRSNFARVLDESRSQPQIIERDGEEIVVISRKLLERFASPVTGASVARFFADSEVKSFELPPVQRESPNALDFGRDREDALNFGNAN